MQIREKGKKVLCIRTQYRSELKRTVPITVASQDKYLSTVSEEVRRQLTETEVEQLENWLSSRTDKKAVDSYKVSLSLAPYSIRRISEALAVDGLKADLPQLEADKIWRALDELQKALRKAGFKRPNKHSLYPLSDENQLLLINN